ncbi:hypothetical protein K458DRAFT_404214 [Lentithecium fluviatile CBS 122367]|uniref:Phage tail collar domain-containing protein n=1 Tax=Lentithecium fluviatile CBS 122367 TaxID=1168545 RepID=A0A6G1J331_9PLEO|nr:hypothetical protein K458DRAFT_404214 [Lentithecium fluviatile CBS 122367]
MSLNPDFVAAGTIVAFGGDNIPPLAEGWHLCDGSVFAAGPPPEYPDHFKAIGHSNGGGQCGYWLPDLRGGLIRGSSSGHPPGRREDFSTVPTNDKVAITRGNDGKMPVVDINNIDKSKRIQVGVEHIPYCYNHVDTNAIGPLAKTMVD